MIWHKCLKYIKSHKLAGFVFVCILAYQIARIAHLDPYMGHFELVWQSIIDVSLSRFIGGNEE